MTGWRTDFENMPREVGSWAFVWLGVWDRPQAVSWNGDDWTDDECLPTAFTHWMPVPEAP